MLSFTWNAPPQYPEVRESAYYTWVVVNFATLAPHQVAVTLTHTGWPEDERWNAVYAYFDKAWETVLQRFSNR